MKTMKTNRKALLTSMLATVAVCAVGGVCAVTAVEASASTATVTTIPAASVRIAEATDSGIRFAAKIDGYDPSDATVKYGMLIVPYELVEDYENNYIEQLEEAYPTVDFAYEYCTPYQAGKTIAAFNDQEGYYIVSSLIDLNDGNYTRDFVAISYTEVDGARTYVSDWEGCKRNIAQVANVVYDDYDASDAEGQAKIAILDTFLDKGLTEKGLAPATYEIPLTDSSFAITKDEEIAIVDAEDPMPLVYTVDDDTVVKIVDGKIVGVGGGEATVTVRYGKYTAECTVAVEDPTIYDAEYGAVNVVSTNISNPGVVEIEEDGAKRKVFSVSYGANAYPMLLIKTKTDLSNVEAISYKIKVAGDNAVGFLPNIPGSAQDREDGYAWTKTFLGAEKTNLTADDGWTTVTVSGLKGINTKALKATGEIAANEPTISYDDETGLYSVWFIWIGRDGSNTHFANTVYLDDFKVESRFDATIIDSCDSMASIAVGVGPSTFNTTVVTGSIQQDDERGSVLQVSSGSSSFPVIKITTSMDLSAYTSSSNTFALTYWVKVTATSNGGLFFLPAVAGCTGNRSDQCTLTKTLLGQDTLAVADGWKQVTISGLYVGINYTDSEKGNVFNGVEDNGDGTYSIYFHYISRSDASTGITSTIWMDEIKIVK